ncbi:MAG: hypothetical protein NTV31_00435 [Bacteroidia bacterium]|nr:hypothetical protein [Bacteroidia bacterium]
MKIEDLKNKVEDFQDTLDIIKQNREFWQSKTKSILIDTLTRITTDYPIGWNVQKLDWTKNSEGVNITLGPSRSGFVENTGNSFKSHTKDGGTITFSQAYNGEIFVIIIYPFIDGFVTQAENKLLGKVKPEEVTEDFIINKFAIFIDEMIKWEKSTYGNRVGFKIEK